jgi:hypothetical protein
VTLSDARAYSSTASPISRTPRRSSRAGELLLKAAEIGKRADIEAATEQIERVLMQERMMR